MILNFSLSVFILVSLCKNASEYRTVTDFIIGYIFIWMTVFLFVWYT